MSPNLAVTIVLLGAVVLIVVAGRIYLNRESLIDLIANSPSVCYECRVLEVTHPYIIDPDQEPPHEFVPARLVPVPEDDLR